MRLVVALCLACGCGRGDFSPIYGDALGDGIGAGAFDAPSGDAIAGACGTTIHLADDFEDGVTNPQWTVVSGNGLTVAETGGFLQITYANNVPASQTGGYRSAAMDFTNTCIEVELVMAGNQTSGAIAEVQLGAGQNRIYIDVFNGMVRTEEQLGAAVFTGTPVTYDAVAHRWLRMREIAQTWYFQASPDRASYTTLFSYPKEFGLQTACVLTLAAQSGSAVGNGGVVQFGSVTVTGP